VVACGALTASGLGLLALAVYPPTRWAFWPRCVMHELTGWHCPGCGLSRAGCALLRGEPAAAFHHHPVFWLLAAPVSAYAAYHAVYALWHDRVSPLRAPAYAVPVLAGVFIVAGLLRNLPGFEFLGP
jgi:hypothetical protein